MGVVETHIRTYLRRRGGVAEHGDVALYVEQQGYVGATTRAVDAMPDVVREVWPHPGGDRPPRLMLRRIEDA